MLDACRSIERFFRAVTKTTYEGSDLEALADMPNYYGWISDLFKPYVSGHVLEYGAGIGTFSQYLRPLSDMLTLVEPSAQLAAALRDKFQHDKAVRIRSVMLEDHVKTVSPGTVNTVVLVNVLEHIEDDRGALSALSNMIAPGGFLLIFVPASPLLMSKLDKILGHFRRYRKSELREKLETTDRFEVINCCYFDIAGVVPWFIVNKLLGSTGFNTTLVKLYDSAIVPLTRAVEAIVSPPFAKNLVIIARRK